MAMPKAPSTLEPLTIEGDAKHGTFLKKPAANSWLPRVAAVVRSQPAEQLREYWCALEAKLRHLRPGLSLLARSGSSRRNFGTCTIWLPQEVGEDGSTRR
jgi:hypothetical protein